MQSKNSNLAEQEEVKEIELKLTSCEICNRRPSICVKYNDGFCCVSCCPDKEIAMLTVKAIADIAFPDPRDFPDIISCSCSECGKEQPETNVWCEDCGKELDMG